MLNSIFKNRKGVTILEGLIALTLLAVVTVGIFGVVLSISRKTNEPSIREDASLAAEALIERLQLYVGAYNYENKNMNTDDINSFSPKLPPICEADPDFTPLAFGSHSVPCMLPPICDAAKSSFVYTVSQGKSYGLMQLATGGTGPYAHDGDAMYFNSTGGINDLPAHPSFINPRAVSVEIRCNGYKL